MLAPSDLYTLAKSRYDEANILLTNHRIEGAVYLAGYALELILKRRIVVLHDWDTYPEKLKDFKDKKVMSFMVHDLDVLLSLSGLEKRLKSDTALYAKWQIANTWNSELRYSEIGKISETEARSIIQNTKDVINFVLRT